MSATTTPRPGRFYVDDVVELDELRALNVRQWGLPTGKTIGRRWRTRMRPSEALPDVPRFRDAGDADDWWLVTEIITDPRPDLVGLWYVRATDRNGIPWRGDLE